MPNANNTQQLVTLPKDVAAALEELRRIGLSPFHIAQRVGVKQGFGASGLNRWLIVIDTWRTEDAVYHNDKLMSALVNGYTIESNPDDRLRKYYSIHEDELSAEADDDSQTYAYCDGVANGVRETLDILGIQIEGVNTPTKEAE